MKAMKYRVPLLAPVLLLPLANVILLMCLGADYTIKDTLVWALFAAAEEVFFRYLLLTRLLLPRFEPVPSVLAVSLLFAFLHLANLFAGQPTGETLVQCFCAFAFALWAGAATYKATFVIPLLAHVLLNLTAFKESVPVSLAVSAVVLMCGAVLLRTEKNSLA